MANLERLPALESSYVVYTGKAATRYKLVKKNSSNEDMIENVDAVTDKVLGVALDTAVAGKMAGVGIIGIYPVQIGGSVSMQDRLVPDANARAIAGSGDEDNVFAIALASSSGSTAGELIPALFLPTGQRQGKHKSYLYCQSSKAGADFPADIIASVSADVLFIAEGAGKIVDVLMYVDNTGTDASNDLAVEGDVDIGGTSCLTTLPKVTKAAADGVAARTGGGTVAGVTQTVIDTTANTLAAGDKVSIDLNLTRTASPSDEMAGVIVQVVVEYDE